MGGKLYELCKRALHTASAFPHLELDLTKRHPIVDKLTCRLILALCDSRVTVYLIVPAYNLDACFAGLVAYISLRTINDSSN